MHARKLMGLEVTRVPDLASVYDAKIVAAWTTLDVVEHTEDTIRRVLRRELTAMFMRERPDSRGGRARFVARSSPFAS